MACQWYYSQAGQQHGPVSGEALKQLAQDGVLRPTDLLWREGFANWRPDSNAKGLTFAQQVNPPSDEATWIPVER
jgi:hypothetical protein